ncbi:MAG: exodeoxyribonuclease VII large subunit [Candidatus Poribacteria bacterium]|nr:exodeoxyribonuclease VII large subunit [Candidatus Poribacteria bacterium]
MPTEFKNVSEITQNLIRIVQDNSNLQNVWIQGKISEVNRTQNGILNFKVTDNSKVIECVIFNDNASLQENFPVIGNEVSVKGQIYIAKDMSKYRFMVTSREDPDASLSNQFVSVSTLTNTLETALKTHSAEVQGKISEIYPAPSGFTIFKLKDETAHRQDDNIIECVLPRGIESPFSLEKGERVRVSGQLGIFASTRAYRINIDDPNNIEQVTEQPTLNECQECHQRFNNLRDQLCPICYDASLTSEGIVIGAVVRYFSGHKFSGFSTERERRIPFGANVGRADVVLRDSENRLFAIAECKRIGDDGSDRIEQGQLKSYLNASGTNLGLFADDTDPYEWIFLKKNSERGDFDEISRSQFEKALNVDPVSDIPPGKTRLELIHGNIIEAEVDAIVNAAKAELTKGSGVDTAIRDAGGEEIERAIQEIAERESVCPPGSAVITIGGSLPAKYVIHAVGPIWQGGNRSEPELLADCYKNSLKIAVENGIRSIAFPAISTGNYGYPIEQAAPITLNTVKEFVEQAHQNNEMVPERIQFVLFDEEAYNCYVKEFANLGFGLSCLIG